MSGRRPVRPCGACSMRVVQTGDGRDPCAWCGAPLPVYTRPPLHVRAWRRARRAFRIGRRVVRDTRVPKLLRWAILAGVVAGPFLIGPFDEILVALLMLVVVWRYPAVWAEHARAVDAL